MRLSTATDRDENRARGVLAAALDGGIDLLDTADAYARDDADIGHNERLIASVIADRTGPRPTVVTKGGLVRPDGAWVPNGRAKHLAAAARDSRDRLGVSELDVYLLHAVDPRTPLATSVRALAKLRDAGVVRAVGLSNVGVHQLEQALAIEPIEVVEVELSPYRLDALRGGLVARCADRGIRVLAHRPLGGPAGIRRLERDAIVTALAQRAQLTPAELALVWLERLGVVPIPGASRVETIESVVRASRASVDAGILTALDAHWRDLREPAVSVAVSAAGSSEREVVILMGMPAAGKSTLAADYAARGYVRLNRDERGGTLADLARTLDSELARGAGRVVLDNTYGTRALRAPVITVGARHDVPVRCVVVETSLEDAQANAVARLLAQHGRLLEPAELRRAGVIGPSVQFRYRREYEPPQLDEGFASVEVIPFARAASTATKRAVIVELDDLVWRKRPRSADQIEIVPAARDCLAQFAAAGFVVAGTTWLTPPVLDERLNDLLGLSIAVARCSHPPGPPVCWCRKPLPGLALSIARAHDVDLARSVHIGRGPADRGFAQRAGMRYADVADGFPRPDA